MTVDDGQDDHVLASVAKLPPRDVSQRHASRLRRRCHAVLQTHTDRAGSAATARGTPFQRVIGPALAGAWCLAYLWEIIRRAAAIYGLPP
jgi:hypothetical protein